MGNDVLLIAVGCLTGVLAGMLGAGGGFATVVLLLAAGATPHVAVGTGLVFLAVMGGWASFSHLQQAHLDRRLMLAVGGAAGVAALIGAQLTDAMGGKEMALALGLFTALVSGVTLGAPTGSRHQAPRTAPASGPAPAGAGGGPVPAGSMAAGSDGRVAVLTDALPVVEVAPSLLGGRPRAPGHELASGLVVGGLVGLCKGLFALGAAFVIAPTVAQLARVRREVAISTTILAVFVASVVGGLRHLTMHHVDAEMLAFLIPGGLLGTFLGARKAKAMTSSQLRRVFLGLMGVSCVYLLTFAASYG